MSSLVNALRQNLQSVIRGKDHEIDYLIAAFLGGGNVLLNDVPGVGKTTLARAIAASITGAFRRVQFTPDLLPADILGGAIYNPREGEFHFRRGPIFAQVLLADEVNRASPRTQSSLLEAMAEGQVSIDGETHPLPQPFWVIATQNPVEYHGTYPLPEAQLDRFAMQLTLGYPPEREELEILTRQNRPHPLEDLQPVGTPDDVLATQAEVRAVHVDEDVARYMLAVVSATRSDERLELGVSPRGSIALYRMSQAWAYVEGRTAVSPDDVKAVAVETLAHRLALETKTKYSGGTRESVVRDLLAGVKVPV
ncbi:MAG: AAA family ATPase [Planctomycetota bacterium]